MHPQLNGTVDPDRPLLVVATKEEAQFLRSELPVLITGIGKVNAAVAVAGALAGAVRPSEVINLGTAGALRPGLQGLYAVTGVIEHDLDHRLLYEMTGEVFGDRVELAGGDGLTLATGDVFVAGRPHRDTLAARADLVDMEGYAVAVAAARFGVPVRMIKYVSDQADENAAVTWLDSVTDCARALAGWVADELG
ncbi:nucleosidase [Actinoplanes sp. NPDC049596]|uniref:nucleosidase n=1 Tax=unclassified Actinoplanes TaxID=2626549 RepID=UPI0034498C91